MKPIVIKRTAALLLIFFGIWSASPLTAATITLPVGTPIQIEITQSITSATANIGQRVGAKTASDVMKDGKIIIRGGTDVQAEVTQVDKKGIVGKPGTIGIQIKSVKAVDGTNIPLSASSINTGENKQILSIILFLLCIFGIFLQGDDGTLQGGTQITANTVSEVQVEIP